MVGLRRHRRVEQPVPEEPPPPAATPAPPEIEAEAPAPASPPPEPEQTRPPIALVPDPEPDRVFDQDDDPDGGQDLEATEPAAAPIRQETRGFDGPGGPSAEPEEPATAAVSREADPEPEAAAAVPNRVRAVESPAPTSEPDAAAAEAPPSEAPGAPGTPTVSDDEDFDDQQLAEVVDIVEVLETVEIEVPAARAPVARAQSIAVDGPILDPESLPSGATTVASPFELPRVIAIANQKGGVGKTTTAVNLGAALAELGFRVLVIDLDPQGNATTGLGINPRDVEGSVYDVLLNDVPFEDIVEPTTLRNLFVAPATIDLAGAEIELVPAMSRELRLKRAIDQARPDYDLMLIDCPPSLGLLTVNGLAAADDVIVPIQCEYYALEGLGQLLRNVGLVQANLNQSLDVRGIILTMYDARTKLADQVESEVRNYFGPKVYRTVVPRTVRLSEAPSFGQPIIVFDSTSRGASAYRELAKEVSRGATKRAR